VSDRYKLTQSVGRRILSVASYKDLARHHPSSPRKPGRHYQVIDGKEEEVRYRDRRVYVKKDFIIANPGGPPFVPSPVAGQVRYLGDATNTIRVVGDDGRMLAQLLHASSMPGRPQTIKRGQPLGIMDDIGSPGSIHVHLEAEPDTFEAYINDIVAGVIAPP
jgi:hypothetical protein